MEKIKDKLHQLTGSKSSEPSTDNHDTTSPNTTTDPLAAQQKTGQPAVDETIDGAVDSKPTPLPIPRGPDGEILDAWDVGKTPPSRFQQREGSLRATPASRSEHTDKCVERDGAFHDKHAEIKDKPLFSLSSGDRRGSKATAESGNN